MEFTDLIKERYSVRSFSNRPVEKEKLDKILDAQNYAPTAVNLQPQKIYVAQGLETMLRIRKTCRTTFGAPLALMVGYDCDIAGPHPMTGMESGPVASATIATYLIQAAWNEGVGSCWVETFYPEKLKQEFDLPESFVPMHVIMMGYAAEDAKPYARWHDVYRPIEDIVSYL